MDNTPTSIDNTAWPPDLLSPSREDEIDHDTMADLIRLVDQAVARHCRRYRCTPDDRNDLAQDAYLAALAAHSSYRPGMGASHNTWANRRVQGQLLDSTSALRSRGMTGLSSELRFQGPIVGELAEQLLPVSSIEDEAEGPEEALEMAEELTQAAYAVGTLRARLSPSDLMYLDRLYGLSGHAVHTQEELAQKLGISQQAVARRIAKILRRCRSILQSDGRQS